MQKKYLLLIIIAFMQVLFINRSFAQNDIEPYLLHPNEEELKEIEMTNMLLMRAASPNQTINKGKKSLLKFLPYYGNDRHQGACGNCWVWSQTASLEIQNAAFRNINDRLSIQYFNSNYGYPDYVTPACKGGYLTDFTRFYTKDKKLIPWSNTNADYKDKDGGRVCKNSKGADVWCPSVQPSQISIDPFYTIPSIAVQNIKVGTDSNDDITQKIKYYLNNNIPLILDYCHAETNSFSTFWYNKDEDTVWDLTNIPSEPLPEKASCHSVTIIGYDDLSSNENENYFEVLNSWGTTDKRPHGIFKIKMNMDYFKKIKAKNNLTYQAIQGIYLLNPNFQNTEGEILGNVVINVIDNYGKPLNEAQVTFNKEIYFTDKNGVVIIPNLKDNLAYEIVVLKNGTAFNNEINDKVCYTVANNKASGTLDFKNKQEQTFTFKGEYDKESSNGITKYIDLNIVDDSASFIPGVTIIFNGKDNSLQNGNKYRISNVKNNLDYEIEIKKDGYIFNPNKIKGVSNWDCNMAGIIYSVKGVKNNNYVTPTNTVKIKATNTKAVYKTPTKTLTNTKASTLTRTPTNTKTKYQVKTPMILPTNTYTPKKVNVYTNTFSFTKTKTFTRTNTPTRTNTFSKTPTRKLAATKTNTPTSTIYEDIKETPDYVVTPNIVDTLSQEVKDKGKINVKFVDILGSEVSNVNVIFNKNETYITDIYGNVHIDNVKFNENFSLVWYRDGYLFDPNFYDGVLTSKNNELNLTVTIYADNAYVSCKEVDVNLKVLRKNISKIYKLSQILPNTENYVVNKKFLSIREFLNKLPKTAMVCKDNKRFQVHSYKQTIGKLQKSIKILYKQTVSINREYKRENNKSYNWVKRRLLKLKRYYNIARKEGFKIPREINYVKE